jgi:hypothetical protein
LGPKGQKYSCRRGWTGKSPGEANHAARDTRLQADTPCRDGSSAFPGLLITLSKNLENGDRSFSRFIWEVVAANKGHVVIEPAHKNVPPVSNNDSFDGHIDQAVPVASCLIRESQPRSTNACISFDRERAKFGANRVSPLLIRNNRQQKTS